MKLNNKKIVVGMSGGVDSSVALYLLKNQGYEPVGVSLKYDVWKDPDNLCRENVCCTEESFEIAKRVCERLGVDHHIVDVSKDFNCKVINYFLAEHKLARTPSPCIFCNRNLKFKKLLEFADKVGAKYIATGHYARKSERGLKVIDLKIAKDKNKDQTYSLCFLDQKILSRVVFPLGELTKNEVYKIAKKAGFEEFEKRAQSQDFCFVSGKSLPRMLEKEIGKKPGKIVDEKSYELGTHNGLYNYTIGQRQGIGLAGGPYYVVGKDRMKNELIVSKLKKMLEQRTVRLSCLNFVSGIVPRKPIKVSAKLRSAAPLQLATLRLVENGFTLNFTRPQTAVTPGQIAVIYKKNTCLGGGAIS